MKRSKIIEIHHDFSDIIGILYFGSICFPIFSLLIAITDLSSVIVHTAVLKKLFWLIQMLIWHCFIFFCIPLLFINLLIKIIFNFIASIYLPSFRHYHLFELHLFELHLFEHHVTISQHLYHFFLQVRGLLHTTHNFVGKFCLLRCDLLPPRFPFTRVWLSPKIDQ